MLISSIMARILQWPRILLTQLQVPTFDLTIFYVLTGCIAPTGKSRCLGSFFIILSFGRGNSTTFLVWGVAPLPTPDPKKGTGLTDLLAVALTILRRRRGLNEQLAPLS